MGWAGAGMCRLRGDRTAQAIRAIDHKRMGLFMASLPRWVTGVDDSFSVLVSPNRNNNHFVRRGRIVRGYVTLGPKKSQ